jgi:hypothetical protein
MGLLLLTLLVLVVVAVVVWSSRREGYFDIDPLDTGIERPWWGPLYTLPNREDKRHMTIHSTPWCVDPLKERQKCLQAWITARVSPDAAPGWDCGPEIPYEDDKI